MIRIVLIAALAAAPAFSQTQAEIDAVAKVLDEGAERFRKLVDSLSDEQWNFKGQGVLHSIGEECEHIALSENDLQRVINNALRQPADESRAAELTGKEKELYELFTDPDDLAENFRSPEKLLTADEVKEYYAAANAKLMRLLRESENLNVHVFKHPSQKVGWLTGLQWFYYIAYHRLQHLMQIDTVLKHPDYPGRVRTAQVF